MPRQAEPVVSRSNSPSNAFLPSYSENEEFRRMFEYEASLSSMLTHANIVQVYDFVKSGETYLLAMEYVDGKNLRQFVNKNRKIEFVPSHRIQRLCDQ